jgi:cell wall-associated NlpC family hydrolase
MPSYRQYTRTLWIAVAAFACVIALAVAATASADNGASTSTGGAVFIPPPPPPKRAKIVNGKAIAPANAPARIKHVITAANRLIGKPYRYGGGHKAFSRALDSGYDCSGSVSYALYGGRFLHSPLPSGDLMDWARNGPGTWLTVYANSGHAYMYVAGLRFDTGMRDNPSATGPAWSKKLRKNASYMPRHPRGF